MTITVDGSWSWRVGAVAERRTAEILSRLGPQWRFRYNVVFYDGRIDRKKWVTDIDCVATGPAGNLALSTKWTSDDWDLSDPTDEWLRAAARGAAKNAGRLAGPIHQALRRSPPIIPMVVCWGPQIEPIPNAVSHIRLPDQEYGDVRIVSGYQADEWLPLLTADRLNTNEVDAVEHVVADRIDDYEDRHLRTREAQELAARPRRWSAGLTGVSAAVAVACTASLVTAVFSRPVLHVLERMVRLGGGAGAVVYVLLPLGLPAFSALVAHRVRTRARDARLHASATPVVASLAVAIMWTAAVTVVYAFAREAREEDKGRSVPALQPNCELPTGDASTGGAGGLGALNPGPAPRLPGPHRTFPDSCTPCGRAGAGRRARAAVVRRARGWLGRRAGPGPSRQGHAAGLRSGCACAPVLALRSLALAAALDQPFPARLVGR